MRAVVLGAPPPRADDRGPVVVITGATRGIGLGMASALVARGARVVLGGRSSEGVQSALASLDAPARCDGIPGDVADEGHHRALWSRAVERFGRVDVWVNNAGTSAPLRAMASVDPGVLAAVVRANLLGTVLGSRVALEGFAREGRGALYAMEGYGAGGERMLGMAVYGSTKRAIRYLTDALADETRGTGVLVGSLSPGVVTTDLLVQTYREGDPSLYARARWLFRFLADPPEVVCPWLADAVLTNRRHGARLAWMTVPKAVGRFFRPSYHRREMLPPRG